MNIRFSFLLILFSLSATAGLSAQPALKRANKNYELQAFDKAIADYRDILSKDPQHLEANCKIADCYRHLNQQDKALPYYQLAALHPEADKKYIFQYGQTLMELGNYELAAGVFTRLGKEAPDWKEKARHFEASCRFALADQGTPSFTVKNEPLNTAGADFGPTFLRKQVVYASTRTDIKSKNSRNAPDKTAAGSRLFITRADDNGWLLMPSTLQGGLQAESNVGPVSYSADGKLAAITYNNFKEGTRMIPSAGLALSLFIAEPNEDGSWANTVAFPHNMAEYSSGFPCLSGDGKALFFASNRPGGFGGYDLYVSYRTGKNWSSPENLGESVNSPGNEITPYFDGNALYFASDYHKGFGGFDIFLATEKNGTWSNVTHGGSGLNSSLDDFGFIFDASRNTGYLVSNRAGGKGDEDIYKVQKQTKSARIKVADALSGQGLANADVDFSDCGDKSYTTDADGQFSFQLTSVTDCQVVVSKSGYLEKRFRLAALAAGGENSFEIRLNKIADTYSGKVVDGSNGYVLEGVQVTASDKNTGASSTTLSDGLGSYQLPLRSGSAYLIRYSKAGYRDLSLNFATGKGDVRSIPNAEVLPVGSSAAGKNTRTNEATAPMTPRSYDAPLPAASKPQFAIQLASMKTKPELPLFEKKIGDVGAVYAAEEQGISRVRVGTYQSRAEAEKVLKTVRSKGFQDAFIVEEKPGVAKSPSTADTASAAGTAVGANKRDAGDTRLPDGFLVRLGAFRNTDNFEKDNLADIGDIAFRRQGEYTIVLLKGYDSRSSAETGLEKARKKGFKDAYLVKAHNGEISKVK